MGVSKFRTTELSNPSFEMDGLRFITVKSNHLRGRKRDICVFVPNDTSSEMPFVTLLHGVYGSAWVWPFLGNAHGIANRLITSGTIRPMVLVMPSDGMWGDGSGYLVHNGYDFEKWIAEDVTAVVIENIPQVGPNSKQFLSGLSMGGYGALRVGSKYGEQYAGISAHSSITEVHQMELFVEESISNYRQIDRANEDVLLSILANRQNFPPLRFDCGRDDELIAYNRRLHASLDRENVPHIYEEFDGGHAWEYWQEHLVDTLVFFDQLLN